MPRQETVQFLSLRETIRGRLFLPERIQPVPVVIICHGAFDYKEHFYEIAEAIAKEGLAALALDMHGHGESGGNRFHVRMEEWTADIQAALGYLRQRPDMVHDSIGAFGFSSGGTAVLEAAADGADLKALVTLDATVRSVLNWYEAPFFRLISLLGKGRIMMGGGDLHVPLKFVLGQIRAAEDEQINKVVTEDPYIVEAYSRLPLPGALECFMVDTIKRVDRITSPVCVIHGARDEIDPAATAELLFNRLKSEKALHILPDSGHVGHMDRQKKEVIRLICQWFKNRL